MNDDPMTRQEYLISLHGPSRLFRGGGVLGGSRAFIVRQEKMSKAAFIPMMMRMALRKSVVSEAPVHCCVQAFPC